MRIFFCLVLLLGCVGLAWGHDTVAIRNGDQTHTLTKPRSGDQHWHQYGERVKVKVKDKDVDAGVYEDVYVYEGGGVASWSHCVAKSYISGSDPDKYDLVLRDGDRLSADCKPEDDSSNELSPPLELEIEPDPEMERSEPPPVQSSESSDGSVSSLLVPVDLLVVPFDKPVKKSLVADPLCEEPVVAPVPEPVISKEYHEFLFYQGLTFVSIPVLVDGIQTVADFWERYSFLQKFNGAIYVYVDGSWLGYDGGEGQVVGDILLTPYVGLAFKVDFSAFLGMDGVPFPLQDHVMILPGGNFVGFPQLPVGVELPSDLIALGAEAVLVTIEGKPYVVGRAGDLGDEPIQPNQALFIVSRDPIRLDFENTVSAAPMAPRVDSLATTWGAIKSR